MRFLSPGLTALVALAIVFPAVADETCYTTSNPEFDTGHEAQALTGSRYYVDQDVCHVCGFYSWWIYEESNGIDGLQRDDEVVDDVGQCRRDGTPVSGDTIVF